MVELLTTGLQAKPAFGGTAKRDPPKTVTYNAVYVKSKVGGRITTPWEVIFSQSIPEWAVVVDDFYTGLISAAFLQERGVNLSPEVLTEYRLALGKRSGGQYVYRTGSEMLSVRLPADEIRALIRENGGTPTRPP